MGYDERMQPFGFLRRLFGGTAPSNEVMQIFTPEAVQHRSTGAKLALGGATLLGVIGAGMLALGSLVTLMLALGAIYVLFTQVLGLKLDLDPRAFVERAQSYANNN